MALVELKRESSPSPSSSSTRQPKYDVFLSFRGEDTRTNFTDHLYVALKRKGIITFRDEEELKKGERISELFKAIEESQFAIIILSTNYASSTWCLNELAKIIKCGLEVFPVFYDVSPSIVRKQTETFEQAFIDHQKRFEDNIEKVETWRDTLKKVADIKGWDLHLQNRLESEIIQDIVKVIMEKLNSKSSSINKNLIGIKSMVAELIPSYLGFENDIYMMAICGMGGLGKTTLASAIYDEYTNLFEGSSFIANVRERSEKRELHELQQQLLDEILEGSNTKIYNVQGGVKKIKSSGLRHKKILLVLDDVNHKDQLEKLAGERDWFGSGSWIIITTRDEQVLVDHKGLKIYKPNGLDDDDALQLFCLKAFKKVQPEEGYMQPSQKVVGYASGLPLALVTLGSFLAGKTVEEWQSALENLKKNPKREIFDILKISYDGLEEMEKKIFLDIACFFRGWNKNEVIQILENCGFEARIGICVLIERSLLTMDVFGRMEMHDLLTKMGQEIIHLESGGEIGKQSRLWLVKDLLHVLENDMATEAIQNIVVTNKEEKPFKCKYSDGFSKMSNLRLLIIYGGSLKGKKLNILNAQKHLALPNNLRHLRWTNCPFKCLASRHKRMPLVQLDLLSNKFEYLWEGKMRSVNLKFIDLRHSKNLVRTPDFSGVPILEVLDLSSCSQLVEIHPSVGQLSKLRYLHLRYCESLTDLPIMSAEMQSLTVLDLYGCLKISTIPKFTGIMKSLSELYLGDTAIMKLAPSSIECVTALTILHLNECRNLECLPSMDNLRSLKELDLSECSKLKSLPRLSSTVRYINTKGCFSLKWSPARDKRSIWSQSLSQWLPYNESGSRVEYTILFHFLQGLLYRQTVYGTSSQREEDGFRTEFQIIIPSCLTQKVGNSISIELPSNWYNSKWIGIALWASVSGFIHFEDGITARVIALGDMPLNHCASELFTSTMHCGDSICLLYFSHDDWFAKVGNGECIQIEVIFETHDSAFRVWECCGVSLVYEQDVEEFNQTNAQCMIESFGKGIIYKLTVSGDDDDDDDDVNTVGGININIEMDDDDDDDDDDDEDDDDDVNTVGGINNNIEMDDDDDDDDVNIVGGINTNIEMVETQRATLRDVPGSFGCYLQNRHESRFIEDNVEQMAKKLTSKFSSFTESIIGIETMVAELIPSYLGFGNDIYMMGICGVGGLGKTTIARALYHMFSDDFEGSSFIFNVRERSKKGELHILQQQLLDEILEGNNTKIYNAQVGKEKIKRSGLRHKKVLLVLDDVNNNDQLEKLAGEHDWFGLGSWIIITTRDEHVLVNHGVLKIYKPNGLVDDDALKLFCLKAFKNEQPKEDYMQLSQEFVKYANGLPLTLVTLGSFLAGGTIDEWKAALPHLRKVTSKGDILNVLKISYYGLSEMLQEIFLDIACFFRRWETKDRVIQILENCGFNARIGISLLLDKSLLTIGDYERLEMHDLLQEMGENIVRSGLDGTHGKQSRLWLIKHLPPVLENDKAIGAIQAIVVHYRKKDFNFEEFPEVLSKMSNLRLMIIEKTDYSDQGHLAVPGQRQLLVPNQLRHLSWNCCPLKCLSSSSQPKKLVQLELRYSRIEYLWEGVMRSCNLEYIDLSDSKNLIRTPDFSGVPRLAELNLSGCVSLVEIHPSIGQLSKLRYLHLRKCESLTDLPSMSAEMKYLKVLDLWACSKISMIPKFTGIMKSLSELNLGYTDINKLEPSSLEYLTALTLLDLCFCTNLECLPSNMDNLKSLEKLILYGCKKLKSLPRLPSTVRFINAQYCNSLKWTTARVKLSSWSQPLSQWCPYDERSSRLEFTILFHFLQELLCHKTVYKIPSCLAHQSVGNPISIELPSNWYNSKWIRFALWASVSGFINFEDGIIRARVIALGDMPPNHCASKLFTTWIHCEVRIGLLYLSREEWFATVGNGECSQIKFIFENDKRTIDVRECGVSMIYEQDVDEFNQTNAQCLIESFGEEVSIYKLTVGDDEDDDDVYTVGDDDVVYTVGDDDDDDYFYDAYTVIDDDGDDIESW